MNTDDTIDPNDGDISSANVTDEVIRLVAEHDDRAAPRVLLEAARDPASPLHRYFTWDDNEAAERYRLSQAGALFRRVKLHIVRVNADGPRKVEINPVRAVVSVPDDRKRIDSNSYGRTPVVMADERSRESVLRGIARELVALRNKYATFSEFRDVWVVIDDIADTFDPPSTKKVKPSGKEAPPPVA